MHPADRTAAASNKPATGPSTAPLARSATVALAVAGLFFVAYPAIRPFSDESSLQGAAAFASGSWLVAHALAMVAFMLLSFGFLAVHLTWQATPVGRSSLRALVLSWVGVALTLSYYGVETFGLAVIGQAALDRDDASLVALAEAVQLGPGIALLAAGLLLLAAGAIQLALVIWRSGVRPRWSGIPLAVGMVLFIPQFLTPQPVRIAHGLVMASGCGLLGWHLVAARRSEANLPAPAPNVERIADQSGS